jgi:hypothetical protein
MAEAPKIKSYKDYLKADKKHSKSIMLKYGQPPDKKPPTPQGINYMIGKKI